MLVLVFKHTLARHTPQNQSWNYMTAAPTSWIVMSECKSYSCQSYYSRGMRLAFTVNFPHGLQHTLSRSQHTWYSHLVHFSLGIMFYSPRLLLYSPRLLFTESNYSQYMYTKTLYITTPELRCTIDDRSLSSAASYITLQSYHMRLVQLCTQPRSIHIRLIFGTTAASMYSRPCKYYSI